MQENHAAAPHAVLIQRLRALARRHGDRRRLWLDLDRLGTALALCGFAIWVVAVLDHRGRATKAR